MTIAATCASGLKICGSLHTCIYYVRFGDALYLLLHETIKLPNFLQNSDSSLYEPSEQ